MTLPVGPKLKVKVREQVQGTVSQLPLTVNDAVLGYINFFSGRGRRTLLAGFCCAGRFCPFIQTLPHVVGGAPEKRYLAPAATGLLGPTPSRQPAGGEVWGVGKSG